MQIIKKISYSGLMVLAGGIIPVILYLISDRDPILGKGFSRKIESNHLVQHKVKPRSADISHFVGIDQAHVFFATYGFRVIKEFDVDLQQVGADTLLGGIMPSGETSVNIKLAGNQWLAAIGNFQKIYFFNRRDNLVYDSAMVPNVFTKSVVISPASIVFRCFDSSKVLDQRFLKLNLSDGISQAEQNVSYKNEDAGMSTDGLLHYDSSTAMLVYSYFYKGEILCLDTNLQVKKRITTISPDNTVKTIASSLAGKNQFSFSTPKYFINKYSATWEGKLYVISGIKADNESDNDFSGNSIVDVYDIDNGSYDYSFYIPTYKGKKIKQFKVFDGFLLAMYPNDLVIYQVK